MAIDLRQWVGRRETAQDVADAAPLAALDAALGRAEQPLTSVPPLRHWLYFLNMAPRAELGRDGHPRLGRRPDDTPFLPDAGAIWQCPTRRMWAGSRITFQRELTVGVRLRRVSEIEAVEEKKGRSGRLLFVTVRHEIAEADATTPAITDWHDIVYREEPGKPATAEPAPAAATAARSFSADSTLLFRYSALTWNGHRIHYDRDYAVQVEGYRGLVVHGPLLATLLADFACEQQPGLRLTRFSFRGMRPVLDGQPFEICSDPRSNPQQLWIKDSEGMLAMRAEAEFS